MVKNSIVILFFGLLFLPSILFAQTDPRSVYDLITSVKENLVIANSQISDIENSGLSTTTNETLVVSAVEIQNKIESSRNDLSQAIALFEIGDYTGAYRSAVLAEDNSKLVLLYLDALQNRLANYNISQIFFQDDILNLISLKNGFSISELSNRISNLLSFSNTSSEIEGADVTSPSQITSEINDPISESGDELSVCITENRVSCDNNRDICLDKQITPVSECEAKFTTNSQRCHTLEDLIPTHEAKCKSKVSECMEAAKTDKRTSACIKNYASCLETAKVKEDRGAQFVSACWERVNSTKTRCEENYQNKIDSYNKKIGKCYERQDTCVTKVETRCERMVK